VILGADRKVTDHRLTVSPSAVQWADGTIDNGAIEPPQIFVFNLGESDPLNSDQARELAAVLLEVAAQLDGCSRPSERQDERPTGRADIGA
jgi:hypothetical protein